MKVIRSEQDDAWMTTYCVIAVSDFSFYISEIIYYEIVKLAFLIC